MTSANNDGFSGETVQQFSDYYTQVRGHVREIVTRANLADFIDTASMDVLDVGGGEGRDAVWLAQLGHRVKLVDPSEDMVTKARARAENAGVGKLVDAQAGDPRAILAHETRRYQLVLSHGVLMYTPDPAAHLRLLHDCVAADGVVSILTKGRAGATERLFREGKPLEALGVDRTNRVRVNRLQQKNVLAVDEFSMLTMLGAAGLQMEEWFGVRLVTDSDSRLITEVNPSQLADILDLEKRMSRQVSLKGMGQMLHFICSKEVA